MVLNIKGGYSAYLGDEETIISKEDMEYIMEKEGINRPDLKKDISMDTLYKKAVNGDDDAGRIITHLWWSFKVGGKNKIDEHLKRGWKIGRITCREKGKIIKCPRDAKYEAILYTTQRTHMGICKTILEKKGETPSYCPPPTFFKKR